MQIRRSLSSTQWLQDASVVWMQRDASSWLLRLRAWQWWAVSAEIFSFRSNNSTLVSAANRKLFQEYCVWFRCTCCFFYVIFFKFIYFRQSRLCPNKPWLFSLLILVTWTLTLNMLTVAGRLWVVVLEVVVFLRAKKSRPRSGSAASSIPGRADNCRQITFLPLDCSHSWSLKGFAALFRLMWAKVASLQGSCLCVFMSESRSSRRIQRCPSSFFITNWNNFLRYKWSKGR